MKKLVLIFALIGIGFNSMAQVDMSSIQSLLQSGGLDQLLQSKGIGNNDIQKLKGMASQYGTGNGGSTATGANSTIVTNTPADSFKNGQPNPVQNFNPNNQNDNNRYYKYNDNHTTIDYYY